MIINDSGGAVADVDDVKKALKVLAIIDKSSLGLFGRLPVSTMESQFVYQNEYSKGEAQWNEKVVGTASATHEPSTATVKLTVSAPDSKIIRQTKRYLRYYSGKENANVLTYYLGELKDQTGLKCGPFDNNNGVYFKFDRVDTPEMTVYLCVLNEGSVTEIPQSDWNRDKLNGTGPSFVNYDFEKSTILKLSYQWLGVGVVRYQVEAPNGDIITIHELENPGVVSKTYMRTANLPIRYEFYSGPTFSGTADAWQICSEVHTEDGGNCAISSYPHAGGTGTTSVSVGTTRRAVYAIRLKETYNTLPNRAWVIPQGVDMLVGSANIYWEILYNPTLTGVVNWTSVDDNSVVEESVDVNTFTGGIRIAHGYGLTAGGGTSRTSVSRNLSSNYPLALDVDGANSTTLVLVATATPSGTASVNAGFNWEEVW